MFTHTFIFSVTEPDLGPLSKAYLLTPVCGKGNSVLICRAPSKEKVPAQRTQTPMAFRDGLNLKETFGARSIGCVAFFWLVGGNRGTFPESESSAFWFRPAWGLCACAQRTVCIVHLREGHHPAESPKTRVWLSCECLVEEPGLRFMLSRVIAFLPSPLFLRSASPLLPD